jgi:hypothetical protein
MRKFAGRWESKHGRQFQKVLSTGSTESTESKNKAATLDRDCGFLVLQIQYK